MLSSFNYNYLIKMSWIIIFFLELVGYYFLISFFKKEKIGQSIRSDGPQKHLSKKGTPTMGGIIFGIVIIVIIGLFCLNQKTSLLKYPFSLILVSVIGYGIIGFWDDYLIIIKKTNYGLSPLPKFFIQLLIASIVYGILLLNNHSSTINLFGIHLNLSFLYGIFILFFFTACTNAVNITDGIDGLCSGIMIIIFLGTSFLAYYQSNIPVMIAAFSGVLALCGFLIFNLFPAKLFMGNTGSMILGGLLGSLFISLGCEVLLLIMGMPLVLETLSDIIQVFYFKITKGKRIFKMAPFHHHLELCNYSEWQIDLIFWSFGLVMALIGVIMGVRIF